MTLQRKAHFIEELKQSYQAVIRGAHEAESRAAETANVIQKDARRREDSKSSIEFGRMAAGHKMRRERALRELETLVEFASGGLRIFPPDDSVKIGALVDVHIEDGEGEEERTLFLLPVGAGNELTGPGGDGFISVVTPGSPVGKALLGARLDEPFEIRIDGKDREWTVIEIC